MHMYRLERVKKGEETGLAVPILAGSTFSPEECGALCCSCNAVTLNESLGRGW